MTLMQAGTYAREADGATLLYHSPRYWRDASYALNQDRRPGLWRRVDDESERAAVEAFLCGELFPGEFVEYQGEGKAYVVGGSCV